MKQVKKLNFFNIALMYIGAIVGAGFASGREIWQFFGVFGQNGVKGVTWVGILFVLMGVMTCAIALVTRTSDMGRIIIRDANEKVINFIGYFIAVLLFTTIATMSAAGGAFLYQQFGIHRIIGGILIVFLMSITVIGGYGRMSKAFRFSIPILFIVVIVVSLSVMSKTLPLGEAQMPPQPSPLAPNWQIAPILYVSLNILAVIPIIGTAAYNAKNAKHAVWGAAIGGVCLAVLAFVICKALVTDMGYAQAMDMPMLALAGKLGKAGSIIYGIVLLFAIYSSATANFYGLTTKIKNDKNKTKKIVIVATLGFLCGLTGFKNIVEYLFPVLGIIGVIVLILVIINFFKVIVFNFVTTQEEHKYDFPPEVINVTTGYGGACLLVIGEEKSALMDCGMAYAGYDLIEKIKKHLNGRPLDYMFASHSHYDHIGALPYLREEWPNIISVGAQHAQDVLKREGALRGIKKLGDEAAVLYSNGKMNEVSIEGMSIDKVVHDFDTIDLGGKSIVSLECPGHTKDSMTYVVEPAGIMLACESVGVLERKGMCHPAILNSFEGAISSIDKCREYNAQRVVVSHYGIVPHSYNKELWKLFKREAYIEKEEIEKYWLSGLTEEEILARMTDKYWYEGRAIEQPINAFSINMINTIRLYKPVEAK